MPRSRVEMYMHLVWATHRREPFLVLDMERAVHRCLQSEAQNMGYIVMASGGMPDHVHLALKVPATLGVAQIVKQLKGASSRLANEGGHLTQALYWQEGYGAFSLSRLHVANAVAYVQNQKRHHAANKLWSEWEQCED